MSNPLSNYSVHYCDSNRGVRANHNISDRYRNPVYYEVSYNFNNLIRKPEHRINEQRTKHLSSVHNREDEELKPADYYTSMLLDEINLVKMRIYNESIPHCEELVNVHRFFFKEAREWLFQKEQTSHLAMEYFVQTIMRCPNLKRNEMGIIAVTSLLLASKFDEIDYSLVSSYHLKLMLETSPYLSQYENKFQENDILGCERSICRRLNWNFHQFTPYHFLQTLLEIGITQKEDYIQDYCCTENSIPERGDISSDPRNLAKRKLNEYSSKYSDYKSTTSNTDEGSNTRNESTHASENQSRKGSFEINEILQTFENSNSFGNVNYPPGCRSVTNEDISKLKEICEYVLNLSTLIVELQNFPASKVAAACLLASRKIMKIHPLWNKNMENVMKYSDIELIKCVNLILSNYNTVTIKECRYQTDSILGVHPYSFKYNSKEDLLCNQDLVELQNLKCSISPRKERKIHDIPQLGEKSKSYKENKYHKSNKQSICKTIKTVTSSPNGILKKINQIEDNYQNFTNTVTLNKSSSKITKPSVKDKKVSFNSQISVKHGSKKLIEMIQDENEEKCSPNNQKQKEKEGIYLRNARSCSGNRPPCVPAKQTKSNSFQTPVEIGAIKSKQFMGSSKPPLSNSNYGINQSTVKKEMEPKKWKLNRIRNNNAKKMNKTQALESTNLNFRYGKQDNNKPISHKQREPYKGKINNDALNLTDDLIGERKENLTGQIQRSYDESLDLSMIEENFEDLTIDEDVPFSLKIVPTKHPSLMVSKAKGVSKNKENNQNSACEQRTKLKKHMNKNCPTNNCKVQPLKSKVTHQREHDRRFSTFVSTSQFYRKNCSKSPIEQNNEIKGETIKGRNVCYEVLDKPSFKKTGSNNVCSIKGNNSSFIHGDIKLLNQINSLLNSSVEEDCEEVKEDSSNACSKPKVMELKRFYSHGMYSNSTESRVRIGVHYTQK